MVSPSRPGKTGAAAAVQAGFRDVLQHAVDDVVPQLGLVGHALVQMGGGDLQGLAHGGDAGHILGACAVAGLLAAAVDQVLGPHALTAVQGTHALGALMGWMVPISLLAIMMLMRAVSGRMAASTSSGRM